MTSTSPPHPLISVQAPPEITQAMNLLAQQCLNWTVAPGEFHGGLEGDICSHVLYPQDQPLPWLADHPAALFGGTVMFLLGTITFFIGAARLFGGLGTILWRHRLDWRRSA